MYIKHQNKINWAVKVIITTLYIIIGVKSDSSHNSEATTPHNRNVLQNKLKIPKGLSFKNTENRMTKSRSRYENEQRGRKSTSKVKIINLSLKPWKIFSQTELEDIQKEKEEKDKKNQGRTTKISHSKPLENKKRPNTEMKHRIKGKSLSYLEDPEYWMYRGKQGKDSDSAIKNYKWGSYTQNVRRIFYYLLIQGLGG